jgi:hypothetical protein
MAVAKKICDHSFAFSVGRSDPGMAFGERERVLAYNPLAMPTTKGEL